MNKYVVETYPQYKELVPAKSLRQKQAGTYRRSVVLLIAVLTLARMVLASVVELGNDEAYYWLYTRHLQWNYFDHPPLVAVWARLFSGNGALDQYELFVRMGSIVGCALATWFMYQATTLLYTERAGWYAAVLYNTSLYAGIVAGLLIMPDSPQMVCWTLSIWMFARILTGAHSWKNWMLFGLSAGLCIMSKVHGVFLWGGAGLYMLLHQRRWLLQPQVYAALLVTALVVSPILFWNFQYDFATYKFHSQRVVVSGWTLNLHSFLDEVWGQVFFNNPVNFLLCLLALTWGWKRLRRLRSRFVFLLYTAFPLLLVLLYLSLFRTVYPHWSGPAYVSLLPVAAIYLARTNAAQRLYPNWLKGSLLALAAFMTGWPLLLHSYPGTWGSHNKQVLGTGDVSLDRYGWKAAGEQFVRYYNEEVRRGTVAPNTPLVCHTWWGAHVEYYFGRPQQLAMIGLGNLQAVHHYLWTNSIRKKAVNFNQAFCIVPSDEYYNPAVVYRPYYQQIVPVKRITIWRSGTIARHFYVYKLSGWNSNLPQRKA